MAAELIGRDGELSSLTAFLEAIESGSSAFVVEGEAGIGKTTVWQAGVQAAELAGCRVLSCRPTGSEARFSFAALGDLLEPVLEEMLPRLPVVQRRALEPALVLSEADDDPAGERAVALGFLGVLRSLAETGRGGRRGGRHSVARRADGGRARVRRASFARRAGRAAPGQTQHGRRAAAARSRPGVPGRALAAHPARAVEPARAAPAAVRSSRGRSAAPALRRLREASGGNPFFALEIGRALVRSGSDPTPAEALPVPETLRELVRDRLAPLPARTRDALLAASALSQPTLGLVKAAVAAEPTPHRRSRRRSRPT